MHKRHGPFPPSPPFPEALPSGHPPANPSPVYSVELPFFRRLAQVNFLILILILRLVPFTAGHALAAGPTNTPSGPAPQPLTNTFQIRALSREQVEERPPVQLSGVATVSDRNAGLLFLHDETGGIYLQAGPAQFPAFGENLEVTGVAVPGAFLPVVVVEKIRITGPGTIPPPRPITGNEAWSGEWDSQWVRIRGHVVHARSTRRNLEAALVSDRRVIEFHLLGSPLPGPETSALPGAEVEVVGVLGTVAGEVSRIASLRLFSQRRSDLTVIRPAPEVLQSSPLIALGDLGSQGNPQLDAPIRSRGFVTLVRGKSLWLQQGISAVRCDVPPHLKATEGASIEVTGQVVAETNLHWISLIGIAPQLQGPPPPPLRIHAPQLFDLEFDGRLVELDATFLHRPRQVRAQTLVFSDDDRTFDVELALDHPLDQLAALDPGATFRLTGVLDLQSSDVDSDPYPVLRLRRPSDLRLLRGAPWPIRHTLTVVSTLLGLLALGLVALLLNHRRLHQVNAQLADTHATVQNLNRDLEQRVADRTSQLALANQSLQQENAVRRRTEQELADRENRLRDAQTIAHLGHFSWELATDRLLWSDEIFAIFGRIPGSFTPSYAAYLDQIHPDDRTAIRENIESALREGRSFERDYRILRPSGELRWVTARVRPVSGPGGQPAGIEGTCQDSTDRKALETQLIQARKLEAVGTLAGGIAHDFNNILAAILGHAELARAHSRDNPETIESLDEVLTAGRRARELIRQMLAFSRPQAPERTVLQLPHLVAETLRLLRAAIPSGIDLRSRCSPPIPAILGDPTQLQQVLINLVTNSAQAIPDHHGWIEIAVDTTPFDPTVALRHPTFRPNTPVVRLVVADNGRGIEPADLPRIFEPFFTTKTVGQGSGLGLSVVHGIVRAHQGVIDVESTPGQGARFTLYLAPCSPAPEPTPTPTPTPAPLPQPQSAIPHPISHPSPKPKSGPRVLFIDDEPSLASAASRLLARAGFEVTCTTDPLDALERFLANPDGFDVVVTDFAMPHCNGLELARRLRAVRPDIPLILCTGDATHLSRDQVLKVGIVEMLNKPVDAFTLEAVVREVARKSAPRPATG